jgi:hypothetical protein
MPVSMFAVRVAIAGAALLVGGCPGCRAARAGLTTSPATQSAAAQAGESDATGGRTELPTTSRPAAAETQAALLTLPGPMKGAELEQGLEPPPPEEPQPRFVCDEPLIDVDDVWVNSWQIVACIDAGEVWEGSSKIVTWMVHNGGLAPLHMKVGFGGCMGNAGPALLELDPGGFCPIKGKVGSCFPLGRRRFCGAAVRTNDPLNPRVSLDAWVTVRSAIRTPFDNASFKRDGRSPRYFKLGPIERSAGPQMEVIDITRGDGGPLSLRVDSVRPESVSAELRELKPGERYELTITANPPWPKWGLYGQVVLSTGVPEQPTVKFGFNVELAPEAPKMQP